MGGKGSGADRLSTTGEDRDLASRLGELGVIPVGQVSSADQALELAEALVEGGLPCLEVTFRTEAAADALGALRERFPDLVLGAGTVLSTEQVDAAAAAGATFVVSPGTNPGVVERCEERGIPIYPGVCTPTEIEWALARGLTELKFFPAEAMGGTRLLKAFAGPYPQVRFIPTGGLDVSKVGEYLALPQVLAVAGTWIAKPELLVRGERERLVQLAAEAVEAVEGARGGSRASGTDGSGVFDG